jgi:hypothetical protein
MKRLSILLLLSLASVPAWATTYYSSPTGSGTTCSDGSPCDVATGIGKLVAGDTLYLKDGTYTGVAGMITVNNVDGSLGSRITITAVNDGAVSINGEAARVPVDIVDSSYITLSGVNAYNSSSDVVKVRASDGQPNYDSYNELKRVAAWNAVDSDNRHVYSIHNIDRVLFEDCAGFGRGRIIFGPFNANYITFRRCWGRWNTYASDGTPKQAFNIVYNTTHLIFENIISEFDKQGATTGTQYGSGTAGGIIAPGPYSTDTQVLGSIGLALSAWTNPGFIWYMSPSSAESGNTGTTFSNVVGYVQPAGYDIYPFSMNDTIGTSTADHVTSITGIDGWNSEFLNGWSGVTNHLQQETVGAYNLYTNTGAGAAIRYRYVDGSLTGTELWPWPMTARIKAALNLSGYDTDYDIDSTIQGIFGTYISPANAPVVTTGAVTSLAGSSLTIAGNVTDDGGGTISDCGACWSKSPNPTVADAHTNDGCATEGAFNSSATGLTPCEFWYIRSWAVNENATVYGLDSLIKPRGALAPGDWTSASSTDTVTVDAIEGVGLDNADTTGSLADFVIANNANRLLLVSVAVESTASNKVSGVVWNTSEALTKIGEAVNANYNYVSLWYLVAPTATTASITASFGDVRDVHIRAVSLYNVNSTPIRDSDTASSTIGGELEASALTMTTVSGDFCLSSLFTGDAPTNDVSAIAPYGSETERWDLEFLPGKSSQVGGYSLVASGASTVIGADWTAGSSEATPYAHVAACIIPSSTASDNWYTPTATPPRRVKAGATVLTHVADDAACPASIDNDNKWCHVDSTDLLYVRTDGGNPGAVTIICGASAPSNLLMMGIGQ